MSINQKLWRPETTLPRHFLHEPFKVVLFRVVKGAALTACFVAIICLLMALFGRDAFLVNVTGSAPIGLYLRTHDQHAPYATFCLTGAAKEDARMHGLVEQGMCPDGGFPLMKLVYRPEQVSSFTPGGFIDRDGHVIQHTAPKPIAFDGKPLRHIPFGKCAASPDTIWALSHHKDGYDSRYFGPIEKTLILFCDRPFLVF